MTARHVAHDLGSDPFVVRMNERKGGGRNIHIDFAKWHFHPAGEKVDVAVMEFDAPDWADSTVITSPTVIADIPPEERNVAPGDIVYVVGIFSHLHGERRNTPIVHTGHIALFPGDEDIPVFAWEPPLEDETGAPRIIQTKGYLVEANTHPASSGSPVFMRRSFIYASGRHDSDEREAWVYGYVSLFGLWQGSWGHDTVQLVATPRGELKKPFGLGTVVPASRILETLETPELQKRHEKARSDRDRRRAVTPQSSSGQQQQDQNPLHKEDFTSLLNAAAKAKPQGD